MESKRIDGKSKTIKQEYLGREDKVIEKFRRGATKISAIETKEFGATAAALSMLKDIGIVNIIDKIIPKRNQLISFGQAFLLDSLNRCVDPSPNYKIGDWYNTTFLKNIFGMDYRYLNGQNFWNWMSKFNEAKINQIQDEILKVLVNKFEIDLKKVLIDFTNITTYQVEHEKNELSQYGAAKDKRYWLRQVNIALATTKEGIPLRHSAYAGNINDPTYYKKFFKSFICNYAEFLKKCEKVWFIHDKGMNNKESIAECDKEEKYHFIGALRPSSCKEFMLIPLSKFKDPYEEESEKGKFLAYKTKKVLFGKERNIIVVYYKPSADKKLFTLTEKIPLAFDEIKKLKAKLNTNKWNTKKEVRKKMSTIINKKAIKGLIEFKIQGKKDNLSLEYWINDEKLQFQFESFGRTIMFTDDKFLKTKDIITAYFKEKNTIEVCNKILKSSKFSRIYPMACWTDTQIRAHIFSCIVSLLVESLMRKKLKENKIKSVIQEPYKKKVPIMSPQEAMNHLREVREEIVFYPDKLKGERILSKMNDIQKKLFNIFCLNKYLK